MAIGRRVAASAGAVPVGLLLSAVHLREVARSDAYVVEKRLGTVNGRLFEGVAATAAASRRLLLNTAKGLAFGVIML